MTVGDVRQIIHFVGGNLSGIRADDGLLMWRNMSATMNAATPVVAGNHVLVSSSMGSAGCAVVALSNVGGKTQADEIYFNEAVKNHHGDLVLVDGCIYGYFDKFMCMDLLIGEVKWRKKGAGKCSLIYADRHLYCLSEEGTMTLVRANSEFYTENSRFVFKAFEHFKVKDLGEDDEKPTWTLPVIVNGKLLLRDQDDLYCYDIRD